MPSSKLTPLTESGLLAALTVILGMAAAYLPVVGAIAAILWPLPAMVIVLRHGLRYGVMAVVVATLIMALLIEPLLSLRMAISFAPTGLVLGYGFRASWPGMRVFAATLVASVVAKLTALGILFFVTQINPFELQLDMLRDSFAASLSLYESANVDESTLEQAKAELDKSLSIVALLFPLMIALMGLLDATVNYFIGGRVLKRLGYAVPTMPPFADWRLPQAFLLVFGFALVGMYWGSTRSLDMLYQVSLNANMLAMLAGIVQGFSLLHYAARRFKVPVAVRVLVCLLIIINGIFLQMLAFIGLFDMAFDYRRRFGGWRG